jgi:hypothetical protein
MPLPVDTLGTPLAVAVGATFAPAGLPHRRHAAAGIARRGTRRIHPAIRASSGYRPSPAPQARTWPAWLANTPMPAHAPLPFAPRPSRHGDAVSRPARPAPAPAVAAPPAGSPVTGNGPAAATAAGGGGAGAAVLMASTALLLIFLLSTRVSLELSAWRSTLLSLRLERPG